MNTRSDMTYSQRVIADGANERPSYFMCGSNNKEFLKTQAQKDADLLLKDFQQYYSGNFSIKTKIVDHDLCYSIGGTLLVNGNVCREYDDIELLFLDLNELMLKRLIRMRKGENR